MIRYLVKSLPAFAGLVGICFNAYAKVETVKIEISGPDLPEPIEITDIQSLGERAHAFGIPFVQQGQGAIEDVPLTPVPPYEVKLFGDYGEQGIRANFVVYFAWDAAENRARVYFPTQSDPWWPLNASTILVPFAGNWYFADEQWGQGIYSAIRQAVDPYAP